MCFLFLFGSKGYSPNPTFGRWREENSWKLQEHRLVTADIVQGRYTCIVYRTLSDSIGANFSNNTNGLTNAVIENKEYHQLLSDT